MGSPLTAIQKAIFGVLSGDATLIALITGVFDTVTEGQAFPYITISDIQNRDWGTMDSTGVDGEININIWSQQESGLECKQIMERIYSLLHEQSPTITGFQLVQMRFDFEQIMLDDDGMTHHGVQRYKFLVST